MFFFFFFTLSAYVFREGKCLLSWKLHILFELLSGCWYVSCMNGFGFENKREFARTNLMLLLSLIMFFKNPWIRYILYVQDKTDTIDPNNIHVSFLGLWWNIKYIWSSLPNNRITIEHIVIMLLSTNISQFVHPYLLWVKSVQYSQI